MSVPSHEQREADAYSPPRRGLTRRTTFTDQSSSGGDTLSASKELQSTNSQQAITRTWGMHGLENHNKQPSNLKLNDGGEFGDGGKGAKSGRLLAERWATGRTTSFNQ